MKLTAEIVLEYQEKVNRPSLTIGVFKAIGRELRDKYSLTDKEAIDILNGRNVLEILAKKEKEHGLCEDKDNYEIYEEYELELAEAE